VSTRRIILASGSPQRSRLLAEAGYAFEVIVPDDREPDPALFNDATDYAWYTAWSKARQIAGHVPDGVIIAADTVVAVAGHIIGKPSDRDDARRILQHLAGSVHQCVTGVCVWLCPESYWIGGVECSELRMRLLSTVELDEYLKSDRWVGKAGAYAIQDPDPYVSIVRGSHSNVVGLPVELLDKLMQQVSVM
jgi:septum formation protein